MTNRRQNRAQEPVLLSWRMSPVRRMIIALVSTAIAALLAYAAISQLGKVFPGLGLVVGLIVALAVLRPSVRTISAFECTASGIRILRIDPSKPLSIRWEYITVLKRLAGPVVLFRPRQGWFLFVGLPKPVMDHLISILREASNARIEGFGEE